MIKNKTAFAIGIGMAMGVMWGTCKENAYEVKRYTGNIRVKLNNKNGSTEKEIKSRDSL